MNEDRMKILELLSQGKISAEEAEKLITALEKSSVQVPPDLGFDIPVNPVGDKFLYVLVQPKEGKESERVSIKIPFALLKAGINIAALMPKDAQESIDSSLKEQGVDFNLSDIDPKNIQEFMTAVEDLSVDIENEKSFIKVFCR